MCNCTYCNDLYQPRPQVTNPRACYKEDCQEKRQRDNEREWREKNNKQYDSEYHEIQREQRYREIRSIIDEIISCLEIGKKFLNKFINIEEIKTILIPLFLQMGIRRVKSCLSKQVVNSNSSSEV